MEDKTAIFLIPAEVNQFLLFREHYDIFSTLIDARIYEVKNGNITINFDHEGTLMTVVRNEIVFKRKS
jgi:hypothetical protein